MQETLANLSADFLFPKLHGIWARSLTGEALQRIVHSTRLEALERSLSPLGLDITRRTSFQKQLTKRFIGEISHIRRLLDRRTAAYYDQIIERYFFENIKTILHYHFFPEREVSIEFLLIDAPELPAIDPEEVVAAKNVNQLYRQIPAHPIREDLLPILVELEDTRDMLSAECRLDQMVYARFLNAAKSLPWSTRRMGTTLVATEIDITNVVMILRNIAMYHLDSETMAGLCIEGGRDIDGKLLEALVAADSVEQVVGDLPKLYRKLLEPLTHADLHLSENALWNHLFRLAEEGFRDYNRPALSVVTFPFLKRAEMLNIGRIFEGVHFGLPPSDIEEMMIGSAHV